MAFKSTIVLCLAAAASVTAYAETQPTFNTPQSTVVSVKHVNFGQPDEVAALYRNISYAAERACGPSNVPGFHFDSPKYTRCYDKAVADAFASLDRSELTAYYQDRLARNGRRLASQ